VTITNSAYTASSSLPLMIWLSPAFPVGSFAYSHALEWAAEAGDLPHATALHAWIGDLIGHGGIRNDAVLLAAAWRAARELNVLALHEVNELALALAGSRERYVETTAQGAAFMIAIRANWGNDRLRELVPALLSGDRRPIDPMACPPPTVIPGLVPGTHRTTDSDTECAAPWVPARNAGMTPEGEARSSSQQRRPDIAYPVAVGLAAGAHDIELGASLDGYLMAFVSNLTSAAIRLSVIGQTDAQRIVMESLPRIRDLAAFAAHATVDDVGGCAFRSDIASMRHETQGTRLFRT
jgi:urease accessory protein